MKRIKVSILIMNLSTNCVNRGYRIAQALEKSFDVELVGTTFGVGTRWGEGLWPPLVGVPYTIRSVRGDYLPGYFRSIVRLMKIIDGDVIIACKPRFPSLGIALLKRLMGSGPVILDIDDDELAQTVPGRRASFLKQLAHVNGYLWTRLIHPFHRFASQKFVVSENFQERYGGILVPHPMDPDELDPARYDGRKRRQELGIADGTTVVGFIGSPDPQKGVDLIVNGIEKLGRSDVVAMIVGANPGDPYVEELRQRHGSRLVLLPFQPLSELPHFLAAADVIALPQRAVAETWGQMPAKLTDAMAMGKPVIAAARADIPKYLEGRGLVFEAENVDAFVDRILWIVEHKDEARALGDRARQYFLENLSSDVVGKIMVTEILRLVGDRHS